MAFTDMARTGFLRLALLAWVITVTLIAIIPLLVLSALVVVADILLSLTTTLIPGVKPRNIRSITGKDDSPGAYLFGWFNWIAKNMNVIFSGVPHWGRFVPPVLP